MTDKLKQEFIDTVLSLKDIPQSPKWHPEGDTLEHLKFIMYGLVLKEEKKILTEDEVHFLFWVTMFHDLGKIDTFSVDEKGVPHAYGHESYAKDYIDKFEEIIPDYVDIDKLKTFCYYHMKAHQYMGTQMKETKKVAFRDMFDPIDFHLLMSFESCDSSLTMYESLRREPDHLDVGYLEPIEFYDEIRSDVPWSDEEVFVEMMIQMIDEI